MTELKVKFTELQSSLFGELTKYCIAGGTGAVIDFFLYSVIILSTSLPYIAVNSISYSTGAIIVFFIQKGWTFRYGGNKTPLVFGKYVSLLVFSYFMASFVLYILIGILEWNPIGAKAVQIILGVGWGYLISKYFVYR